MGVDDGRGETRAAKPVPPASRTYRETPWGRLQAVPEAPLAWGWLRRPPARLRAWARHCIEAASDRIVGIRERLHAWRHAGMSRRARAEWWDYYERRAESGHDFTQFPRLLIRNGPPDVLNPYAHADPESVIPGEGCIAMDISDVLAVHACPDTARSKAAARAWLRTLATARPIPETLASVHRDNLLLATFEAIQMADAVSPIRIEHWFRAAARVGLMQDSDVAASVRMATLLSAVDAAPSGAVADPG